MNTRSLVLAVVVRSHSQSSRRWTKWESRALGGISSGVEKSGGWTFPGRVFSTAVAHCRFSSVEFQEVSDER
jgi:hypothetical protein